MNNPNPSFTKLKKIDQWGVRVPKPTGAQSGDEITVHKRGGQTDEVRLGAIEVQFDDAILFRIAKNGEATQAEAEQAIAARVMEVGTVLPTPAEKERVIAAELDERDYTGIDKREVPEGQKPCEHCEGHGKWNWHGTFMHCGNCNGHGHVDEAQDHVHRFTKTVEDPKIRMLYHETCEVCGYTRTYSTDD